MYVCLYVSLCVSVCVSSTLMQYPRCCQVSRAAVSGSQHGSQLLHLFRRLLSGQQRAPWRVGSVFFHRRAGLITGGAEKSPSSPTDLALGNAAFTSIWDLLSNPNPKLSGPNCKGKLKMTCMVVINMYLREINICKEDVVANRSRWNELIGSVDRGMLDG